MRIKMIFHKKQLSIFLIIIISISLNAQSRSEIKAVGLLSDKAILTCYQNLGMDRLDFNIFEKAIVGYSHLNKLNKFENKDVLTIIDYSKSSNEKRLYVVDLLKCKILFHELVAHGKNSGNEFATEFSNENGSNKSCLGFYSTAYIYYNSFGYTLKLIGLEEDINNKAFKRGIVFHGSDNINFDYIDKHEILKQSNGCLTVSHNVVNLIVDKIKGGSCIFVYANNEEYFSTSKLFKSSIEK